MHEAVGKIVVFGVCGSIMDLSRRTERFFGGKGANRAVVAARIGRGGSVCVAMAGAVGEDPFGKACRENLQENGIDVQAVRISKEPTG